MKRNFVPHVFFICLVTFLALGMVDVALAQSDKPRELTFSSYTAPTQHITLVLNDFCREVEKATNGQLKITMYPAGTLTKADQILDGVIKGLSETSK